MKTITQVQFAPPMPKRKRTGAYTRVSSGKDAMLHSLSAQVSYYSAYIQKRADWEFAGIYADEAVTGTRDGRAEFQRLLDDCRTGKIDQIITKSITRFARNTVTLLKTVRELKLLGIDVYFEEQKIHTMSAEGELVLAILAAHAQENSLRVSESCKWRIRKQFQEGKTTGCTVYGYEIRRGDFFIIPAEALTVKAIFRDYMNNGEHEFTEQFICVNEHERSSCSNSRRTGAGIETLSKKYGFSYNAIRQMLRNEKYAGDLLLQKSYVADHLSKRRIQNIGQLPKYLVRDHHEAIIDRATFDAVQAEITRRHLRWGHSASLFSNKAVDKYPLTGLVKCGCCGAAYRRKHTAAGTKYEKIVWICDTFNVKGKAACPSQQIPEAILLAKVEEAGGFESLTEIRITGPGALSFLYKDRQVDLTWQNPSRSQSWTPEMKEAARQKSLAAAQKRKTQEATP